MRRCTNIVSGALILERYPIAYVDFGHRAVAKEAHAHVFGSPIETFEPTPRNCQCARASERDLTIAINVALKAWRISNATKIAIRFTACRALQRPRNNATVVSCIQTSRYDRLFIHPRPSQSFSSL
jgi:hypothetical protein